MHVAYPRRRRARAAAGAVRDPQPALRLRQVRPQLRAAHAAQLLVQQLARLVPGVRRAGHADRREPGGAAARSEADAGEGRRGCLAGRRACRCSQRCSTALCRAHRPAARRAVRAAHRRGNAAIVLHGTRRGVDRRRSAPARRKRRADRAAVPLSIQGPVSRARRSLAALAALCGQAASTWSARSSARPAAAAGCATMRRPCGSATARSTRSAACRWASWSSKFEDLEARRASEKKVAGELLREVRQPAAVPGRRRPRVSHARPRRRRRSPAARPSASAWPARSAADCAACCTCSTSRRSACTRATTAGCSTRSTSSATWATRCSSSSTTAK